MLTTTHDITACYPASGGRGRQPAGPGALEQSAIKPTATAHCRCADNSQVHPRVTSGTQKPRRRAQEELELSKHRGGIKGKYLASERALLPLGSGKVSGTLGAVPGAVRVPGQAALGAGFPVHLAAVQGHLGDAQGRAQVQLLLKTGQKNRGKT